MQRGVKKRSGSKSFIIKDYDILKKNVLVLAGFIFLVFLGILITSNTNYTGHVVNMPEEGRIIFDEWKYVDGFFETFDIEKEYGTNIEIEIESNVNIDLFVKKGYCEEWDDERDILFIFENIDKKIILLGNRRGSLEDREIYKGEHFCLIVSPLVQINNNGLVEILVKEKL